MILGITLVITYTLEIKVILIVSPGRPCEGPFSQRSEHQAGNYEHGSPHTTRRHVHVTVITRPIDESLLTKSESKYENNRRSKFNRIEASGAPKARCLVSPLFAFAAAPKAPQEHKYSTRTRIQQMPTTATRSPQQATQGPDRETKDCLKKLTFPK